MNALSSEVRKNGNSVCGLCKPLVVLQKLIAVLLLFAGISTGCTSTRSQVIWPEVYTETDTTSVKTIPIMQSNRLILVKGEADGVQGYFIFDTGAPGLVLNQAHFKDYWVDPSRSVTGVNGETQPSKQRTTRLLKIGEVAFKKQWADVIDLSHIERKRQVKILGLLGVELFKDERIEIDLRKKELRLFRNTGSSKPYDAVKENKTDGRVTLPIRFNGDLITLEASIDNRRLKIAFDTGSETLLLDKNIVTRYGIKTRLLAIKSLLSTDGTKREVRISQLQEIQIGVRLKQIQTMVTDLKTLKTYGLGVDGLIGFDLLNSGVVSIDFNSMLLQLTPYQEMPLIL